MLFIVLLRGFLTGLICCFTFCMLFIVLLRGFLTGLLCVQKLIEKSANACTTISFASFSSAEGVCQTFDVSLDTLALALFDNAVVGSLIRKFLGHLGILLAFQ